MQYLRAVISVDKHNVLYKKDFEAQKIFEGFVRTSVSNLIRQNVINKGEHYSALIIPHYGQYMHQQPTLINDKSTVRERYLSALLEFEEASESESSISYLFIKGMRIALILSGYGQNQQQVASSNDEDITRQKRPWITLLAEEPIDPEKSINFFSLEIYVLERSFMYREDFQMHEIDNFWQGIEHALQQLGILRGDKQCQRNLYARDDEEADFEHDEVHALPQAAPSLIEIVPTESLVSPFPRKKLTDFNIQVVKRLVRGKLVDGPLVPKNTSEEKSESEVHILITRPTLDSVQHIALSGAQVEQGGVLVGHIYENAQGGGYLVEITDHIQAEGAIASEAELRYTFETWQRQTALLKAHYPGKRIVGWYHTHLITRKFYVDESHTNTYTSGLFFSQDDFFTHRQFFREKWYVAMVLDTKGNLIFYRWVGEKIKARHIFYTIA